MILLTGGSGLLGQELQKYIKCAAPPRSELEILDDLSKTPAFKNAMFKYVNLIVHCAAFTDLHRAEKEKDLCYKTNVLGTRNLASLGIPMLYISTEYVFDGTKGNYVEEDAPNPLNFYSLTKLLGEYESRRTRSVVIRCLFKPRPFKHPRACHDQFTSGSHADVIAQEISLAVKKFNDLPPTLHIGFERKSIYALARETREVEKIGVDDIKSVRLPRDCSLNCDKWNKLKEGWKND